MMTSNKGTKGHKRGQSTNLDRRLDSCERLDIRSENGGQVKYQGIEQLSTY